MNFGRVWRGSNFSKVILLFFSKELGASHVLKTFQSDVSTWNPLMTSVC